MAQDKGSITLRLTPEQREQIRKQIGTTAARPTVMPKWR